MATPTSNKKTEKGNAAHIKQLCDILDNLKVKDVYVDEVDGFSTDKTAIERIFKMTDSRKLSDILLRLTVIDSMYSTQMNRRYYGLQKLAENIRIIEQDKGIKRLCVEFLAQGDCRDARLFDGKANGEHFNLFAEHYGIGKDGSGKGVAVSLISKYAYFETDYGFPIYDSIACEMYPQIWNYCGFGENVNKLTVKNSNQRMDGDKTIVEYTKAIDVLIARLGGKISYDHLDRLLWFVGKILRGNLSLVLDRKSYEWCVDNWFEKDKKGNKVKFDVAKVNIDNAYFCRNNSRLKAMFELAQKIKKHNNE